MVDTRTAPGIEVADLLRDASARLSEKTRHLAEMGPEELEEVGVRLERVVGDVAKILAQEQVAPAHGTAEPAMDVQLVHALRAELLRMPIPPGGEGAALELIRALEALCCGLQGEDPDDLRARLSKPDAFGLLVEVAHDLRSPLTSVLFLAETLRGGHSGPVTDHQRSQLGLIYSAALGLASLASDIVDLARQESGLVDLDPEPYSIRDVLQGVEEMVLPMAEEKHIELIVSAPHYDRGYGHPLAIGRVLLNLTTNAIKFTDKGFVELGAKLHGRRQIEYWVRDTGRGIPPELQAELFRPFKKRGSREGHFFSGSGVGLSIARRMARAMGSDLELESAPDWGTRFRFRVDLSPVL